MVPDALNRKLMVMFLSQRKELLEGIILLELDIVLPITEIQKMAFQFQPLLVERIKEAKKDDSKL